MDCNRFEELFIKDDETELLEHINNCDSCAEQYRQMKNVSKLLKEVKPLYERNNKNKKIALSLVAGVSLFCLAGFVLLNTWLPNYNYDSAVSSGIYPVDEYGLVELY